MIINNFEQKSSMLIIYAMMYGLVGMEDFYNQVMKESNTVTDKSKKSKPDKVTITIDGILYMMSWDQFNLLSQKTIPINETTDRLTKLRLAGLLGKELIYLATKKSYKATKLGLQIIKEITNRTKETKTIKATTVKIKSKKK